MKITGLLCAGLLAMSSGISASLPVHSETDSKELNLSQHLWDEEWSLPSQVEGDFVDEAKLMDLPAIDEQELVATAWWDDWSVNEPLEITQYLWDEEWSSPAEISEDAVDEAQFIDLPTSNEGEMVATGWWENYDVADESNLVTQHLWDEEWSLPSEGKEGVVDGLINIESTSVSEGELIATGWWENYDVAGERQLLTQHLWDEEWSLPSEGNEDVVDGLINIESTSVSEDELVATGWWENYDVAGEQQLLTQHLWDEEWTSPSESLDHVVNEAQMDLPSVDESEMVATAWWDDWPVTESLEISQYLWDEEWSSPTEPVENSANEAQFNDLPPSDEGEMIATGWWENYDVVGESQLLTQHLWDEEWSLPGQTDAMDLDEAHQEGPVSAEENETVAAA